MNELLNNPSDDVLYLVAETLIEERIAQFDAYNKMEHIFSERFEKKRKGLEASCGKRMAIGQKQIRWNWKRIVCCAVMILLLTVTVGAMPAIKGVLVRAMISRPNANKVYVTFVPNAEMIDSHARGVLSYLPEGYSLYDVQEDYCYCYRNSSTDDNLIFMISSSSPSDTTGGAEFTVHGTKVPSIISKKVMINNTEGIMIQMDNLRIMTWSDGKHTYSLQSSHLSEREIVLIAESVK
ncbi:MAG: DUF4367 domain-containing protein [Clostridia bacterium]|nr:DUF4367 domain-containing protein [Clostridia bacterium]